MPRDEQIELTEADGAQPATYEISLKDHRLYRLVYFVLAVLEMFLIIRFLFKLLGVNPENGFARFVYFITNILLFPFQSLFQPTSTAVEAATPRIFDPAALVAMIVYALIAFAIARLLLIMKSRPVKD